MNLIQIYSALESGDDKNLFPEAQDTQKWQEIKNADCYQNMLAEIYQVAEYYLEEPLTELPYSLYKLYRETGSRWEYEDVYFDRRARLSAFTILVLLEPENNLYLSKLEDTLWAVCNEYSWVLPAHQIENDPAVALDKYILQGNKKVRSCCTIDLFAAETAFTLSEIYFLLKKRLTAQLSSRIKKEVYQRVLKPYLKTDTIFPWELMPMNWAAVCSASIGSAAIYLIKDNRVLVKLISNLLNTMEVYLSGFFKDGVCQEGLEYWNYGFGFYTYFAELLKNRTAGQINLMERSKIKAIALFQQKAYLSADKVLSFSDTRRRVKFHAGLSSYLNKIYAEFELPDITYRAGFNDERCYRCPQIIRDLSWFTPEAYRKKVNVNQESLDYFPDSQYLIYKKLKDNREIIFAAKGGSNNEPHNHNDIGSFLYHSAKTAFLTDLGSGEYTKGYFGVERYQILCNGSQGHSLPIINGGFQQEGDFSAVNCNYQKDNESIKFSLDIAAAYNNKNLNSLLRNFCIYTGDNHLSIEDNFRFRDFPETIIERFISLIKPVLLENGRIRLEGEELDLIIFYKNKQLQFSCLEEEHINHDGIKEDVYLLNFTVKKPILEETVKFNFIMRGYHNAE